MATEPRKREGWMDSTTFENELGVAIGGEKVYADQEDLLASKPCLTDPEDHYCQPMRVYVFDADEFDKWLHGAEASIPASQAGDAGSNPAEAANIEAWPMDLSSPVAQCLRREHTGAR
jgi:hypothetical protein